MCAHVCAPYCLAHLTVHLRSDSSPAAFKAFRSLRTEWGARRLTGSRRWVLERVGATMRRSSERAALSMKSLRSWTRCSWREAMEWIGGICCLRRGIRPWQAVRVGTLNDNCWCLRVSVLLFGSGVRRGLWSTGKVGAMIDAFDAPRLRCQPFLRP
jgi:hypothetical protein